MLEINRDRLIECREKYHYSQKYVALSVGVAPSIVSRWESGVTIPSRENLSKLADLYGVTVDYLLGRTEDEMIISEEHLLDDELKLIQDYRSLNEQGKQYIRQTMYMALSIYIKHSNVSGVEEQVTG